MSQDEDFRATRKRLWDELVAIHDSWHQYQFLFMGAEERVRILNTCAGWFFASLQRLLVRDTILGISRLTDPLESRGRTNLVLRSLLLDPKIRAISGFSDELAKEISDVESAAKALRTHRNRYIAHLDHATVVGEDTDVLPGVSAQHISDLIGRMEAVYNLHGNRVHESHAFFDLDALGSVEALVRVLENSDRWRKFGLLNGPSENR